MQHSKLVCLPRTFRHRSTPYAWALFDAWLFFSDFLVEGLGESNCVGRATPADVSSVEGRRAFGLQPFQQSGDSSDFIKTINELLF